MKYPCNMIEDLLPLYYDGVCSVQSKKIVEEHLAECDACKNILEKLQNNTCDDHLQDEKETIIRHYQENVKKKLMFVCIGIASVILLVCFIVNLATGKSLDWFFIVLTSLGLFSSFTAVPLIVEEKKRLWTFCSFAASLILLLLTCSLYSNGDWFFVAALGTLLGLSTVFLPFVIHQIPLKGFALQNKGLVVIAIDTMLLYFLIFACGFYGNSSGYWSTAMLITTALILFVWFIFAVIRYFKVNGFIKSGICLIAGGLFFSMIQDIIYWIMEGVLHISFANANLSVWNTDTLINANSYLLILLAGCVIGLILLLVGATQKRPK